MSQPEAFATDWQPIDPNVTEAKLAGHLQAAGVPLDLWGHGEARTVSHLLKEVRTGESKLSISSDGTAVNRHVDVAWVDVYHLPESGAVYYLQEARQVYSDGTVIARNLRDSTQNLKASLGEKMLAGEHHSQAAMRALGEELSIAEPATLHYVGYENTPHSPARYPGLPSEYDSYKYVATLVEQDFMPCGYKEEQTDKTNYYVWKLVRPPVA